MRKNKIDKAGIYVHYYDGTKELMVKEKIFALKPKRKIPVAEIESVQAIKDNDVVAKSGLGGAVLGSLIAGGAGLIAGAIIGKGGQKEYVERLAIEITLKNGTVVDVPFITARTKTKSTTYMETEKTFNEALELIDKALAN